MFCKISLFVFLLTFVSSIASSNKVDAAREQSTTKEQCVDSITKVENIPGFINFAKEIIRSADVNEQQDDRIINQCMHSVSGLEDIKFLKRIVEQSLTIHSVCVPEFADQLLQLDTQLKSNVSRGKLFKRKQTNRLSAFFRLFAGQVVLSCKKSLSEKLKSAEENNRELIGALGRIYELSAKNDDIDPANIKNIPKVMRKLVSVASRFSPTVFTKVENLLLFDSLKPSSDAVFSIGITLNTEEMLNEFLETKRACKIIDEYAQSSIYTITKLAWRGYLARDTLDTIDDSLKNDQRLQKWLKVVQYCQGVLVVKAKLDLDQESIVKLDKEVLNDEQIITINLDRDSQQLLEQQAKVVDKHHIPRWHKYEQTDTLTIFDDDLICYTYSYGLAAWLTRRLGKSEQAMARYIKLSVLDDTFKQSMISEGEEVQFGGGSGTVSGIAFTHATNHLGHGVTGVSHHAHHFIGGSPGVEFAIILVGSAVAAATIMILMHLIGPHCGARVN